MTIKEISAKTGLSHQAIYKRIKAHGFKLETLKDKATGQFTTDGEKVITELFQLDATAAEDHQETEKADSTEVEKLRNQVAELSTEVEKLRNQVATITDERDFLRTTLEREQQLHGMALSKLPTPTALPSGNAQKGRLRLLWDKIKGGRGNG